MGAKGSRGFVISIAMATYNGAKHLQGQLNSFLSQTRLPDELVVCDDGSTDDTLNILNSFKLIAPFEVRILCNKNRLGFTKNFEQSMLKCRGDIVFLSDQDDVWSENKVEIVEEAFRSDLTAYLVVSDGKLVDEELRWFGATALNQVVAGFGTSDALVVGALTALHKNFMSCALPIPDRVIGHDVWLHNLARRSGCRKVLEKSLQLVRRHSLNTSNWIASSVNKINKLDVLKSHLKTRPASSYEDRVILNRSLCDRLMLIDASGGLFSRKVIRDSLDDLRDERRALETREKIPSVSFIRRLALSFLLVIRGDYRFFNGYKSFLRDILR